jgi:hypothetical protein
MHYGGIDVVVTATAFDFVTDGKPIRIARLGIAKSVAAPSAKEPLLPA